MMIATYDCTEHPRKGFYIEILNQNLLSFLTKVTLKINNDVEDTVKKTVVSMTNQTYRLHTSL